MWRDSVTEKSWRLLQELRSRISFTLIGGWAVYLYTQGLKSKDIDIVVDYETLQRLGSAYQLAKNRRLKKYEFAIEGIDVDTYVPYYSDPGLPAEELLSDVREMSGFRVPSPEALLVTKQRAESERTGSDKGFKDRVDIISILLLPEIDMVAYAGILKKHDLTRYASELEGTVARGKSELEQLGIKDARRAKIARNRLLSMTEQARRGVIG